MKIIDIEDPDPRKAPNPKKPKYSTFSIKIEEDVVKLEHTAFGDPDEYDHCALTFSRLDYQTGIEELIKNRNCLIKGNRGNLEIVMEDKVFSTVTIYIPVSLPKYVFFHCKYKYYKSR